MVSFSGLEIEGSVEEGNMWSSNLFIPSFA